MMSAIRGRTGQKKSELGLGITHTGQAGSGSALDDSSFCAVFIINTLVIAGLFKNSPDPNLWVKKYFSPKDSGSGLFCVGERLQECGPHLRYYQVSAPPLLAIMIIYTYIYSAYYYYKG